MNLNSRVWGKEKFTKYPNRSMSHHLRHLLPLSSHSDLGVKSVKSRSHYANDAEDSSPQFRDERRAKGRSWQEGPIVDVSGRVHLPSGEKGGFMPLRISLTECLSRHSSLAGGASLERPNETKHYMSQNRPLLARIPLIERSYFGHPPTSHRRRNVCTSNLLECIKF
jgi:hypothetical protein